MNLQQFNSLEVGDVIETKPLFPGLGPEPMTFTTALAMPGRREFVVNYYGVALARMTCVEKNGELTWAA